MKLASSDLLGSSRCLGADTLMKLLGNYCRNAGFKTAISVGIVGRNQSVSVYPPQRHCVLCLGFPNVGKSRYVVLFCLALLLVKDQS